MPSDGNQIDGWNCTHYPDLKANPDIGGIGTIFSFVVSAYLTLICCVGKARIDHLRSPDKTTPTLDIWSFAVGRVILSFSDQQVVVGIAVLLAGLSQLSSGLDSYHWITVLNLAWFSGFTHILTLTAMRVENRSTNEIRNIRLCAMGILAVILLCMMYTVGLATGRAIVTLPEDPAFPEITDGELTITPPSNLPAWCLFQPGTTWKIDGNPVSELVYNWLYVTLALLILIYSYATRALLLYFDSLGQVVSPVVKLLRLDKLADFGKHHGFPEMKSIERRLEGMELIFLEEALNTHPKADSLKKNSSTGAQVGLVIPSSHDSLPMATDLLSQTDPTISNISQEPWKSQVRIKIINEVWFNKLIITVYGMCISLGSFAIWVVPASSSINSVAGRTGNGSFYMRVFAESILFDCAILWLATLIFIDHDIQRFRGQLMYAIKYGDGAAQISKLEIGLSTYYIKTTTRSLWKWDGLEKGQGGVMVLASWH
ncbi:hypothetical protein BOTCAL_0701g00020 [Botryotinia calthae]|uniref:Uncharacterized protein n=1 Tax=Botryotinia calthae TaxID=38488 RepID=A0A4Y8CH40_9HELO|nr:hypothetical protein BOTCAL_0701g00020 [Botryotinia calthae]